MKDKLEVQMKMLSISQKKRLAKTSRDPQILSILANDENEEVRQIVALNQACTGRILEHLRKDPYIAVACNAMHTIRLKFVDTEYQRQIANQKLLECLSEDPLLQQRLSEETLQFLYETKEPLTMDMANQLMQIYADHPSIPEHILAMQEGILLGSMLSGAYDYPVDLMIAQRSNESLDAAKIEEPVETKKEAHRSNVEELER